MTKGSTPGRYLSRSLRRRPHAPTSRPPTVSTAAATIPTGSKAPAIGWPRCRYSDRSSTASGRSSASPSVSRRNVAMTRPAATGAASDARTTPADRQPDARRTPPSRARARRPRAIGVDDVAGLRRDAQLRRRRRGPASSRRWPQARPSPLSMAQRTRDSGAASTRSSRRRPSSLDQPARKLAPANPRMNEPKREERELQQRPTAGSGRCPG